MHGSILGLPEQPPSRWPCCSRCYPALLGGNPVKSLYWGFSQHWLSTPKVPKADEGQDPPAPLPMRQGPSHCNQAGAGPPEQRTCL